MRHTTSTLFLWPAHLQQIHEHQPYNSPDRYCRQVRDQLMDWLCEREMTVYQTIFSMSGDAAKLDRFERRFAWFKGRLEERKEVWAVFPTHWRVPQTLCLTFCKITKVGKLQGAWACAVVVEFFRCCCLRCD
jgi:hypothetical protein